MQRTLTLRWAGLGVLILGTLFALTSTAFAQDSPTSDRANGVRVHVHGARLTKTDVASCVDERPVGKAVSKQVVNPNADPHRAILNVAVEGLHCRGGHELTVVVRGHGETTRVGQIRIDDNGNGRARFATGAGDPIPFVHEGDTIALVAVNDIHGAFPVIAGRFEHRLTYFVR